MIKVKEALALFKEKFSEVFYIPGNHDLWLVSEEEKGNRESMKPAFILILRSSSDNYYSLLVECSPLLRFCR